MRGLKRTLLVSLALSILVSQSVAADDIFDAIKAGDAERVKSMLDADAGLLASRDHFGNTPLDIAAVVPDWAIFKLILEYGPDVNNIAGDGGTVMHRAAHYDEPEMFALLIAAGSNIHASNQWGRTPLHVAARRGCKGVAELLLANGADPNAGTREGWTPLHVAYKSDHPALIEVLITGGADQEATDQDGRKPRDYAFTRPPAIALDTGKFEDYVGTYDLGGGFTARVWREGDKLCLKEFGRDEIYPVGEDEFFCVQEPWKVTFTRGDDGAVDTIYLGFLRRTVSGTKVK